MAGDPTYAGSVRTYRRCAAAPVALAGLLASACTGSGAGGPGPSATPAAASPAEASPPPVTGDRALLASLPECGPLDVPTVDEEVPGLVAPPSTVLTSVAVDDPLTQVEAIVELDPIAIHAFYREESGLESLVLEDEILEAEGLLQTEGHRFFFKARAMCRTRSVVLYIVAPDTGEATLPQPAGSPPP